MTLSPGERLGPYEIQAAIGAGGMGEVYKARDTRLDRSVAIKVLPADVSADPDRRARFAREAKTIAGLNHPHICTLHDVGETDGTTYLVMEHLTGETLAQRLEKGPLPLEQALTVATEIADALAAAHRQGVIHRDLKPGNVMLTKTGARLLDFGLAKLRPPGPVAFDATGVATRGASETAVGTLLGTLPYMAPEQLEGRDADARTDIWALGCVLYEMAAGRRAFEGKSQASLIGAIMTAAPPPLVAVQPLAPAALDHLVRSCLAKDPDERMQNAHDVVNELRWLSDSSRVEAVVPVRRVRWLGPTERLGWSLVTLALLGVAGVLLFRSPGVPVVDVPLARLSILLPSGVSVAESSFSRLAISPDGQTVAFAGDRSGMRQLYVRHLDRLEAEPLAGSEGGATMPFFSRDSKTVGFWLPTNALMQVPVAGGTPTLVAPGLQGGGAVWDQDGTVIAGTSFAGLQRIRPGAEKPETLTTLSGELELGHVEPQLLPGGNILFVIKDPSRREDHNQVAVYHPDTRKVSRILSGVSSPRYVPDGYLLFARGRTLRAAPFDAEHLQVTGDEMSLTDDLWPANSHWFYSPAGFDVAPQGTLAYVPAPQAMGSRLALVDRSGREEILSSRIEPCTSVATAPDGQRLAVQLSTPAGTEIQTIEITRDNWTRISYGADHGEPAWTPDGSRVVFPSNRDGAWAVYAVPADGSRAPEPLTAGASVSVQTARVSFPPDGHDVLFTAQAKGVAFGLWSQKGRTEQAVELLSARNLGQAGGAYIRGVYSPNGKFLAYLSRETGAYQAYVRQSPGFTSMSKVSAEGAAELRWSRDSRELFYRVGSKIMSARVMTTPQVSIGRSEPIVDLPGLMAFDVMPDGRFVTIRRVGPVPVQQIVVIPDWKRLLPTSGGVGPR